MKHYQEPQVSWEERAAKLSTAVERELGVRASFQAMADEHLGWFDGATVVVNANCGAELQLYVLLHLVGHTIQVMSGRDMNIGVTHAGFAEYEKEAARYALCFLHRQGITELDAWFVRIFQVDAEFMERFAKTGVKGAYEVVRGKVGKMVPKEYGELHSRQVERHHAYAPTNFRTWQSADA